MGQIADEAIRPAPVEADIAYTFEESNPTTLEASETNLNNYDYTTTLEATEWQRGNDYLLDQAGGTTSGEFVPNLEYPVLTDFNAEDYSIESSRFLPPVLFPSGYSTGGLSYDFLNRTILPLDPSASNTYTSYSNPEATDVDYSWTYAPHSEELDELGLEVIGNNPIYPPSLFEPVASSSSSNLDQSTATFLTQNNSNNSAPSTSSNPSISTQSYDSFTSNISGTNPYAVLAALAAVTPNLVPSNQVKTRPLSLLKQPTALQLPSKLISSARPIRSNSLTENSKNWQGLYSSSGFDLVGMLARVASRPNAQINIGPVDTKSAFVVCDANQYDQPIIFASETFKELTGYSGTEILGQNCRFLQSPDGVIVPGSTRQYMDGRASFHLKRHISAGKESQTSMINYCKGGKPFINLLTVIPITWDSDEIAFYVGFQVSLAPSAPSRFQRLP